MKKSSFSDLKLSIVNQQKIIEKFKNIIENEKVNINVERLPENNSITLIIVGEKNERMEAFNTLENYLKARNPLPKGKPPSIILNRIRNLDKFNTIKIHLDENNLNSLGIDCRSSVAQPGTLFNLQPKSIGDDIIDNAEDSEFGTTYSQDNLKSGFRI